MLFIMANMVWYGVIASLIRVVLEHQTVWHYVGKGRCQVIFDNTLSVIADKRGNIATRKTYFIKQFRQTNMTNKT